MGGGVLCVLFTDLVGSTELMVRLGDAGFDKVRGEHFAGLRQAVAACGGTEVKNTGDGLLATFTSVVGALTAAVRAQQATDRHGGVIGVPLAIRVGLALGEVALEDGDVFGTPVVEAARLVANAQPGQILTSGLVRAVAGTRAGVTFTDLGCVELKGLPEPVAVCQVSWEPFGPGGAVPLPNLLLRTGRVFVGRDVELDRLRDRWKEAAGGGAGIVLLGGEPGIGKTRLAVELAELVHGEGGMVLGGRCDEDMGVPYQPFVEALRHYVAHGRAPLRLGRYAGELVRLLPELVQLVPGLPERLRSDPETERYRLFDALAAWLGAVSMETPVLLVLDDLHWAAKPTLLLLRHVLRSAEPKRLLVMATYRDTDVGRSHPLADLLADVHRLEGAERLGLAGLDVAGVTAFLEAAAGHELDQYGEVLARAVWRETEGNCFFVAEVLRHLAETGVLEQREGRWAATGDLAQVGIPEGVRDVVGRRLSRLSETANRVLAAAAVVGLEFEPVVVEGAGGFGEELVLAALEEAATARLVVDLPGGVPRNRFAHALVRATIYDELPRARRASLHRRVAQAIEATHAHRLDDHLPVLAHHWSRADRERSRAVGYAARAGERALAQLAHDEAATFYAQALELVEEDDERRLELLVSLGEAQRRAGDAAHRETLLEAARVAEGRGDSDALCRAVLANSRVNFVTTVGAVDDERVGALEASLRAVGSTLPALRARLLATLGNELAFTPERERRTSLSNEALELAHTAADLSTLAHVLTARFFTILGPGTLYERLADTALLLEVAESLGDPIVTFSAQWLRCRALMEAGEVDAAVEHLAIAERLASELGQPTLRWLVASTRVGPALLAGNIEEADRRSNAAFALGQATGQPDATTMYGGQQCLIRFEQGRLGELVPLLEELRTRLPQFTGMVAVLVHAYVESGRVGDARALFQELAANSFDLADHPTWLWAMMSLADVARGLDDRPAAQMLYERLLPYGSNFSFNAGVSNGCTAYHLGTLATLAGRFPEAEGHFSYVAGLYEKISAPAHLGRTHVEWARMLLVRRASGDREEARRLLDRALGVATRLRLVNVERRARAVLEAAR